MNKDFMDILASPKPGDRLAVACAQGRFFGLPFLDRADEISAGPFPFHKGSTLGHICRCMNEVAGDPIAVWMAFCHDAGKLTTPACMLPHHYGHETRGELLTSIWARILNADDHFRSAGVFAARTHMRAGKYPILRPGKKLGLLEEIFSSSFAEPFLRLINADTRSVRGQIIASHWFALENAGKDLSREKRILLLKNLPL